MIEGGIKFAEQVARRMSVGAFEKLTELSKGRHIDLSEDERKELIALGYLNDNGSLTNMGRDVAGDKRFVLAPPKRSQIKRI